MPWLWIPISLYFFIKGEYTGKYSNLSCNSTSMSTSDKLRTTSEIEIEMDNYLHSHFSEPFSRHNLDQLYNQIILR
jgi:hypothetical protein